MKGSKGRGSRGFNLYQLILSKRKSDHFKKEKHREKKRICLKDRL